MSEYTSCPICYETFDANDHLPLILSCGHTICKSSLRSIADTSSQLLCPLDRKPESRPISRLPKNILILQIAEQSRAPHSASVTCKTHLTRLAEFKCEDCGFAYCSKCIVKEHQHHSILEIDNESGEWKKKLHATVQEVKEDFGLCEKAYDLAVSHHSLVLQEEVRLKDRLKADIEALRQILNSKEEDLRRYIGEKCSEQLTEVTARKNELAEELRLMSDGLEVARNYENFSGTSDQIRSALQEIAAKRHFLASSKMSLPASPSLSLSLNVAAVQGVITGLEWKQRENIHDQGVGPMLTPVMDDARRGILIRSGSPIGSDDSGEAAGDRIQCTYCNRAFASDRIHIHVEACRKVTHRRVQPMDFSQRRRAAFQ